MGRSSHYGDVAEDCPECEVSRTLTVPEHNPSAEILRDGFPIHEIELDLPFEIGAGEKRRWRAGAWLVLGSQFRHWNECKVESENTTLDHLPERIRQIVRHFFHNPVAKAIRDDLLPRPAAIVLSGGQQNHLELAQAIGSVEGVPVLPGYPLAWHVGIALKVMGVLDAM